MKVEHILNEVAVEDAERGDMDNPIPFDRAKFWKAADSGDEVETALVDIYKKKHGIGDFTADDYGVSYGKAIDEVRRRHGAVVNVPIDKIMAGEGGLYKSHVEAIMRGDHETQSSEFPVFYEIGGVYYAIDGNHRIAAAYLQGHKKIQGQVMNLDKLTKLLRMKKIK